MKMEILQQTYNSLDFIESAKVKAYPDGGFFTLVDMGHVMVYTGWCDWPEDMEIPDNLNGEEFKINIETFFREKKLETIESNSPGDIEYIMEKIFENKYVSAGIGAKELQAIIRMINAVLHPEDTVALWTECEESWRPTLRIRDLGGENVFDITLHRFGSGSMKLITCNRYLKAIYKISEIIRKAEHLSPTVNSVGIYQRLNEDGEYMDYPYLFGLYDNGYILLAPRWDEDGILDGVKPHPDHIKKRKGGGKE